MLFTEKTVVNFDLRDLQSAFRSATIGIVRTKEEAMKKGQAVKTKVLPEADPLGELRTPEFVTKSFNEAIEEVRERQRLKGQDSPCAVDGKRAVKKPDGRVVLKSENTDE